MSESKQVALKEPGYSRLDVGPESVRDFFSRWERAAQGGDSLLLHSLLHWGFSVPVFFDRDGTDVASLDQVNIICHYLDIANGHAENWELPNNDDPSWRHSPFSENKGLNSDMVHPNGVRRMCSKKAWSEIVNKKLKFSHDVTHIEHLLMYREMADKLLWFFGGESGCRNVTRYGSDHLDEKAREFLRRFLNIAFTAKLPHPSAFEKWVTPEQRRRYTDGVAFYKENRGRIVRVMAKTGFLELLRGARLDKATRDTLKEIIRAKTSGPLDLIDAGRDPEPMVREAAGLLLAYPTVQKLYRRGIHEQNARKRELRVEARKRHERDVAEARERVRELEASS